MEDGAPKSRDSFLATPVAELVSYWLGVRCTHHCNRTSYIPLKLVAAKRGPRVRLRAVLERLHCNYCRTPPSAVWITDYPVVCQRSITWLPDDSS